MCVSLDSSHESFIPATFMYTTLSLLPMSVSVSKNRTMSDVHDDVADDRLTPRELGTSFDISWRRDTIDISQDVRASAHAEMVFLIWFGGNAACVALYWRGLASTPVWRIPRNPGIPWGPSLKTLKKFLWLAAEHMSCSRFSSVPRLLQLLGLILLLSLSFPPHPVSAVGLLQSKEILPPPPPRLGCLEHSPSFARRRSSLCSMCHHVGELGGQISIDWLGPQGSGVCCWRWCFATQGFTSVVMQPSLRSPLLLLSRLVVRSLLSTIGLKQFVKQISASGLRCFKSSGVASSTPPAHRGGGAWKTS